MAFKGLIDPKGKRESVEAAAKHPERYGLPAGLLRGLARMYSKHRKSDVSVTELVDPPQISVLKERHDYYMEPKDMVWAVLGTATHQIIAEGATEDQSPELHLVLDVDGVKVSGSTDLYEEINGGTLWDFKTTKVYAVKQGVKPEWEAQMNLYAHLCRKSGLPVASMKLVALLKDWAEYQRKRSKGGYPDSEIHVMDVPVWQKKRVEGYLEERIHLWKANRDLEDAKLTPCTSEETWGGRRCERYCAVKSKCFQLNGHVVK